jgi:hypothetical protein
MSSENDWQLPTGPRILNIIGVILLGLGVAKHFGGVDVIPPDIIPSVQPIQNPAFVLIAAGIALQAPALICGVREAMKRLRPNRPDKL